MENVEGRVAVVTGAASGVGFALARELLRASAKVVVSDIEVNALDNAVRELSAVGDVVGVVCDVSKAEAVQTLADRAVEHFGAVDMVFNNAGVESGGRIEDITPEQWKWVLDVNFGGVLNGVQAFLPVFRSQGRGHFVATASIAGLAGSVVGGAPYAISKSAVITLCESLHEELRLEDSEINVSAILLGNVHSTEMGTSGRNRPQRVPPPKDSELRRAALAATSQRMATALSPDLAAARILEGVRAGQLYIKTHPDITETVARARAEAFINGPDSRKARGAGR